MTASDASVAVAAFASWHPLHRPSRAALGDDATIVGHAALETYSVLTRLPERFRATPARACMFLAHDATLLSIDRRAAVVYGRLGVAYELIG